MPGGGPIGLLNRRAFVTGLGAVLAAPLVSRSKAGVLPRVGYVGAWYSPSAATSLFDAFRLGMRELGYVEGRNVAIEARWMERIATEEAARLTAELVRSKVDVLVAQGPAIPGVKVEAGSVPIVFGFSGDPVAANFVTSL